MCTINLNQNQFSDLLNIVNNVFYPLNNFVNEKEFIKILKTKTINGKFFPYPILFGIKNKKYFNIKKNKIVNLYFQNKIVAKINKINFFNIDKNLFGEKIYGKNYNLNPYFIEFNKNNKMFMSFNFLKIFNKNLKHKFFVPPLTFKKKLKKKINLAGFHTRNVPHAAHEWIHNELLKKFDNLLIQPLVGQFNKGEYKDQVIIKLNKLLAKIHNKKNIYVIPFFSYPRYAGSVEAALHSIVRKNYGCTHFWVGRDHAGYKNFFKIYESQKYCKKKQKSIGIKIVSKNEPYYCKKCKKIKNFCNKKLCSKKNIVKISGTKIRKLIIQKKNVPKFMMNEKLSKKLSIESIINY
tara:strand:+ start:129 stop:1178 length:1050 start_codon:yes stop_codon:yes gene_type:complete